ncbi:MAG: DUF5686 family protein [Candidatus Symbiothrix sp.]|jgi:hypothetical protein|nr:DUF5686 family protein [Candidatus Symbiothrix sp.]
MEKLNRLIIIFVYCLIVTGVSAQHSPVEIKYSVMDFYALRYYPFKVNADSIVQQVIDRNKENSHSASTVYQKTSVNLVANKEFQEGFIQQLTVSNNLLYKYVVKPYGPWLQYAAPLKEDARETALTIGLHEKHEKDNVLLYSKNEGIYGFIGKQDVAYLLDELFGTIDLFKDKNEVMLLSFKSPLTTKNKDSYRFFLSSKKIQDNRPVYEVVFYSKNPLDNAFTGYLYITADGNYSLLKAIFTMNNPENLTLTKDILLTQTFETKENKSIPLKKEAVFMLGDEIKGSLLVNRTVNYTDTPEPLTASEQQVGNVVQIASQTRHFQNLQKGIHFLMTDHLTIGGEKGLLEWGPILEAVSYNAMEGLRVKAGGNTTLNLNKHFLFGGYLAYGSKDRQFKYRGDIIYSFLPKDKDIWEFPKRLLSVTYIRDLNIPGQDLMTGDRDNFFYSFSHARTRNLSLQKLAAVSYEHEWPNRLSYKIGGKYWYDRPVGRVQYFKEENGAIIKDIATSEMNVSLRYAPGEIFIQNREKRLSAREGHIELNIQHRMGFKGIFGSNYNYRITNFSADKQIYFPQNIGKVDVQLSAGKIWNRVPFPLLFIPAGNHSYIFMENDYNQLNQYEFTTDRFVAGRVNFRFNWSPVSLFCKSKVKTNIGAKAIYGPLSDNNNPDLHPELFIFNQGVKHLGNTPYVEMNIGLSNIFKVLRVEWVQRLTYPDTDGLRGSFFVTTDFSF